MAGKLINMNKLKQIISLSQQGQSRKQVARATGCSKNTVKKYLLTMESKRWEYHTLLSMEDNELEELFTMTQQQETLKFIELQAMMNYLEAELKRVGVNRQLLWAEYKDKHPGGYSYSQFCHYIQRYQIARTATMHFEHEPGDKIYIDYAGKKLQIVDRDTGEIRDVEVYIATLGYSQLTYVEASMNQKKENYISCTENALKYFGGVPKAMVCDNLKSAVTAASNYEADINNDFLDFANHYHVAVLPARSYKPKDKPLVEKSVSIIYSRIYAKLRDRIFYSLAELNQAIRELLEEHNNTQFQGKDYSRRQCFEKEEKQCLGILPETYQMKEYCQLKVQKNCHVRLHKDKHYYSVPYRFIGEQVKLIYTQTTVSIYHKTERIAVHTRNFCPYKYSTIKEHLPSTHQFVMDWSPEKFISWATAIDKVVEDYIKKLLDAKQYPEQAYKSCVGILSMEKKVGKDRLIAACKRADNYNVYNYKVISNILEGKLDTVNDEYENSAENTLPGHENIRGAQYYIEF